MSPAAEPGNAEPDTDVAGSIAARALDRSDDRVVTVIGEGKGVFSTVYRVAFADRSVVVKMPRSGPNGDAARASGAYERERIAYERLLSGELPVPRCHAVVDTDHGPAFVLEDLTGFEHVDQLVGLSADDALAVVDALVQCHQAVPVRRAQRCGVRSVTPRGFAAAALERGVDRAPAVFGRLLAERESRIEGFGSLADPVVCHGDPRADNLVTAPQVKLFDWQQIAVQAGEADLAWLLATSLHPEVRRQCESGLVERYADAIGRSLDESWERYRSGFIVPGLAVLLLAQRRADGRLQHLVETSITRIAVAVEDHL